MLFHETSYDFLYVLFFSLLKLIFSYNQLGYLYRVCTFDKLVPLTNKYAALHLWFIPLIGVGDIVNKISEASLCISILHLINRGNVAPLDFLRILCYFFLILESLHIDYGTVNLFPKSTYFLCSCSLFGYIIIVLMAFVCYLGIFSHCIYKGSYWSTN